MGKEEDVKIYVQIQTRTLKIEEMNASAKVKEVDNKQKVLKIAILSEEAKIMSSKTWRPRLPYTPVCT
jgi:hypothetical protein